MVGRGGLVDVAWSHFKPQCAGKMLICVVWFLFLRVWRIGKHNLDMTCRSGRFMETNSKKHSFHDNKSLFSAIPGEMVDLQSKFFGWRPHFLDDIFSFVLRWMQCGCLHYNEMCTERYAVVLLEACWSGELFHGKAPFLTLSQYHQRHHNRDRICWLNCIASLQNGTMTGGQGINLFGSIDQYMAPPYMFVGFVISMIHQKNIYELYSLVGLPGRSCKLKGIGIQPGMWISLYEKDLDMDRFKEV